jgi:exodeoxyribonuclease III
MEQSKPKARRCAIYTRKSSEEGLEQDFNSLHAQACRVGWTDALRKLHPNERIYTFCDYFRNAWMRDAGLRIDHLLLSSSIAPRLVGAGVDLMTSCLA